LAAVCSAVSAGSVATGRPLSSRGEAAKAAAVVAIEARTIRIDGRKRNQPTVQFLAAARKARNEGALFLSILLCRSRSEIWQLRFFHEQGCPWMSRADESGAPVAAENALVSLLGKRSSEKKEVRYLRVSPLWKMAGLDLPSLRAPTAPEGPMVVVAAGAERPSFPPAGEGQSA
jgi:hypothetical protein